MRNGNFYPACAYASSSFLLFTMRRERYTVISRACAPRARVAMYRTRLSARDRDSQSDLVFEIVSRVHLPVLSSSDTDLATEHSKR